MSNNSGLSFKVKGDLQMEKGTLVLIRPDGNRVLITTPGLDFYESEEVVNRWNFVERIIKEYNKLGRGKA